MSVLAYIPARGGSKRIPRKNIRRFAGRPLIARTIEQACAWKRADRVVVDTDDEEIARVAKRYGAEVPFLRPKRLAGDRVQVADALRHLLALLKKTEKYSPEYAVILQTTSPLREVEDIERCWMLMRKTDADTVLTVAETHPRLYLRDEEGNIHLANRRRAVSTNIQAWPKAYLLNGCFVYILNVSRFLKQRRVIMRDTKAVVCDRWRSVDLDSPEEWVVAELLYSKRGEIKRTLRRFAAQPSEMNARPRSLFSKTPCNFS